MSNTTQAANPLPPLPWPQGFPPGVDVRKYYDRFSESDKTLLTAYGKWDAATPDSCGICGEEMCQDDVHKVCSDCLADALGAGNDD